MLLTLVMLNIFCTYTTLLPIFYPVNIQHSSFKVKISVDPNQMANPLALLCVMFSCVFVTFQCGVLCHERFLFVSIPDHYLHPYFHQKPADLDIHFF